MDVLTELQALHAYLASVWHSTPPPPFDDKSLLGSKDLGFMYLES